MEPRGVMINSDGGINFFVVIRFIREIKNTWLISVILLESGFFQDKDYNLPVRHGFKLIVNKRYNVSSMKRIFHLSTCSTSQRIIREIGPEGFDLQDIKTEKITPEQLDEMAKKAGSYEALFSRKALKYRALGLHEKQLTENDYRQLILDEYTFLKRPVIEINGKLYVGNAKSTVAEAKAANEG